MFFGKLTIYPSIKW